MSIRCLIRPWAIGLCIALALPSVAQKPVLDVQANVSPQDMLYFEGTVTPRNLSPTGQLQVHNDVTVLVELIERNEYEITSSGADIDLDALKPVLDPETDEFQAGIAFSDRPLDDPDAGISTAGWAPGLVTLQGAEYQCDSLVTYTFEVDPSQPGGIRTDVQVILP